MNTPCGARDCIPLDGYLGGLGEWAASVYPRFGEMFVIVARQ